MICLRQCKLEIPHTLEDVREKAARELKLPDTEIEKVQILRQSLDARKKEKIVYLYDLLITLKDEKAFWKRKRKPENCEKYVDVPYVFPALKAPLSGKDRQ